MLRGYLVFAAPVLLGSVSLGLGTEMARAQEVEVTAAVECFEAKLIDRVREPESRTNPQCKPGVLTADAYLIPGKYERSVVVAVLDGLEQLAMTTSNQSVRTGAVSTIASAGSSHSFAGYPELEVSVVPWLLRLYRNAPTSDVKVMALNGLMWQADRQAAAEALGEIAADVPAVQPAYHRSFPEMAVHNLRFMGAEGEAVLRRLLAEDRVQNPGIRSQVEEALRSEDLRRRNP